MTTASSAALGQFAPLAVSDASPAKKKDSAQEISDRFLSLLVAQMKNQDPLNPLENAEVTSQMAQINTVNGIAQLNNSMKTMAENFGFLQSMQAAALVGREVMAEGNRLLLGETGSVRAGYVLDGPATGVRVNVVNEAGELVYTTDLGPQGAGTHQIDWDGNGLSGDRLPPGTYRFDITAVDSRGNTPLTSYTMTEVRAVRPDATGTRLINALGQELRLSEIKQFS
jgi:flagellar basal-body rod modification protein FlgD